MAHLVVETSAWASYFEGESRPLLDLALESAAVTIPALVQVELLGNPISGKEKAPWERFLSALPIGPTDREHFERAGRLKREMESRGFAISARDAHVIQTALDLKAILVTEDSLFLDARNYCGVQEEVG